MRFFLGFSFFLYSVLALGKPIIKLHKSDQVEIRNYLKIQNKFFKSMCSNGEEQEFWKLYKKYQGNGIYIPYLSDDEIDRQSILKMIPEMERKEKWIGDQIVYLNSLKYVRRLRHELDHHKKMINKLLKLKYEFEKTKSMRSIEKSKKLMSQLANDYEKFLTKVSFLLPYRYPINYLTLRGEYDQLRNSKNITKKNEVYLYRKVLEDGALNPSGVGTDFYMRGLLGSLSHQLKTTGSFLNENLRYDLMSAIDFLKNSLKRGKRYHLKSLKNWKRKTSEQSDFYKKLLTDKELQSRQKVRKLATQQLKEFVYQNNLKTYRHWRYKREKYKAMFVLETILFNEVGNYDGPGFPESRDVARVVLNRFDKKEYNTFLNKDPFLKWSNEQGEKLEDTWLNILFKTGEFSFTYFYIPGNVKTYCPDMSRRGKKLRRQNLQIALDILREKESLFKGVRYFSRASMTGRIDMAKLWNRFEPVHEEPGLKIGQSPYLLKFLNKRKFEYYYSFKNSENKKFDVMNINKKTYVMHPESKVFYRYRNPHLFRFFTEKY